MDSNCNQSSTKVSYPTYWSFCVLLLGQISFLRLLCWHRKMSQSVVATVPLETRLTLWNFSLLHVSTEKPTIYFQKQALKGVPIYTVLSKIFKSLKNYKLEQISWSKFLKKITVNETSKSYYCPPDIKFFHTSFSKNGYHLERPDIKKHLWMTNFFKILACLIKLKWPKMSFSKTFSIKISKDPDPFHSTFQKQPQGFYIRNILFQNQPPRGVSMKRYSANMQQN